MLLIKMGFRNLFRQRRRTVLTASSMVFSVLMLGATFSLNDGMYGSMIELFTRAYTGHTIIQPVGYLEEPSIYTTLADDGSWDKRLTEDPDVKGYIKKITATAMVFIDKKTTAVQLTGLAHFGNADGEALARQISRGSYQDFVAGSLLLGFGSAQVLGVEPGQDLVVISQGADGSIANAIFRIAGIIGKSPGDMTANTAFLHLDDAQEFLSLWNRVHEIPLILKSHENAQKVTDRLNATLPNAVAVPWWDVQKTFYRTMTTDKESGLITVYIIVAMSSLVVLNTVLMMLLERTREYGILSALGTRPGRMFAGIVTEVACLAIIGIAAGLVVNTALLFYLSHWGINLPEPLNVAGIVVTAMKGAMDLKSFLLPSAIVFVLSVTVSLWPAWRAARASPIAAIRQH